MENNEIVNVEENDVMMDMPDGEGAGNPAEVQEALRKKFVMPERAVRGVIKLAEPIKSKSRDVHELHYDFSKLTGSDLVECLDKDPLCDTGKQISNKQAKHLCARACGKAERGASGLDEYDILSRVSALDMVACVRAGRVFFAHALAGALLSTFDA